MRFPKNIDIRPKKVDTSDIAILRKLCLILKKVDTFRNTKLSTLWI